MNRVGVTHNVCGSHPSRYSMLTNVLDWSLDARQRWDELDFYAKSPTITRCPRHPLWSQGQPNMCFPHIINICTTHVIESFTNTELAEDQVEFILSLPPQDEEEQGYEKACRYDPIALCCGAIRAIHASGSWHDHFDNIICDGNAKGWFKLPEDAKIPIILPQLQLLCDVKTRWDSIHGMMLLPWTTTCKSDSGHL